MRNKIIQIVGNAPGKALAALRIKEDFGAKIYEKPRNIDNPNWDKELNKIQENFPLTVVYFLHGRGPFLRDTICIEFILPGNEPYYEDADYTIENDLSAEFFDRFSELVKQILSKK